MNTRNWSIRSKIVALVGVPLAALLALWIFATALTIGPALNLLSARTILDQVSRPAETLVAELQRERRLSLVYLAVPGADGLTVAQQRARTDAAATALRVEATGAKVRDAAGPLLLGRINELLTSLPALPPGRAAIDRRELDRPGALNLYNGVVDAAFRMFGATVTQEDPQLGRETRALIAMGRAREVLGQSDSLLAGALAAGGFGAQEHLRFVQIIGTQRYLYGEAVADLSEQDRASYLRLTAGSTFGQLHELQDRVVNSGRSGEPVPVDAAQWQGAYESTVEQLRDFERRTADALADRAAPVAVNILVRLAVAGVLGLSAVVLAIAVSVRMGRSLIRRLGGLRGAALQLAKQRLPDVVTRLRRGESVDVNAEAPALEYGTDEIGQLGHAFTEVQRTAVQSAVDEAQLRRGLNEVFLNIARRSQTLLHRQLALLDRMERRTTEPAELDDLFRVDHLATRMRRHAEDLVILAGAAPGRGWRNPVPFIDVIRGAVSEVEDYRRIDVGAVATASLAGRAVGDVIHLLAELLENATSFSPPHTRVQVAGELLPNGFAVEIEDRGLGMTVEALEDANRRLAEPPDFDPTNSARLGLFVVSQLGVRHGVRVRLRPSPYGGVTAVALIPIGLVVSAVRPAEVPANPVGVSPDPTLLEPILPGPATTGAQGADPTAADQRTAELAAAHPSAADPAGAGRTGADVEAVGPAWSARRRRTGPPLRSRSPMRPEVAGNTAAPPPGWPVDVPPPVKAQAPDVQAPVDGQAPVDAHRAVDGRAQARPAAAGGAPVGAEGLPRRIRQSHLAPRLREPVAAQPGEPGEPGERTPEQVRAVMSSLQAGTARGRMDATGRPVTPGRPPTAHSGRPVGQPATAGAGTPAVQSTADGAAAPGESPVVPHGGAPAARTGIVVGYRTAGQEPGRAPSAWFSQPPTAGAEAAGGAVADGDRHRLSAAVPPNPDHRTVPAPRTAAHDVVAPDVVPTDTTVPATSTNVVHHGEIIPKSSGRGSSPHHDGPPQWPTVQSAASTATAGDGSDPERDA